MCTKFARRLGRRRGGWRGSSSFHRLRASRFTLLPLATSFCLDQRLISRSGGTKKGRLLAYGFAYLLLTLLNHQPPPQFLQFSAFQGNLCFCVTPCLTVFLCLLLLFEILLNLRQIWKMCLFGFVSIGTEFLRLLISW